MIATPDGGVAAKTIEELVDARIAAAKNAAIAHANRKHSEAVGHANRMHNEAVRHADWLGNQFQKKGDYLTNNGTIYLQWKGSDDNKYKNSQDWVGLKNGHDRPMELQSRGGRVSFQIHKK